MNDSSTEQPNEYNQPRDSGFELSAPSEEIAKNRRAVSQSQQSTRPFTDSRALDARLAAEQRPRTEWKGFEEEEEFEPEVNFAGKGVIEDELDMTPMVDIVFLLLIFFMVTASFTLQKSMQQPPTATDDPSLTVVEDEEDDPQYVEIIIDQFNTYRLTSKDVEEVEAPSDQEMRVRLADMIKSTDAKKLIITAHGDATNEKVVTAWDAGITNDVVDIVIRLTEQDY